MVVWWCMVFARVLRCSDYQPHTHDSWLCFFFPSEPLVSASIIMIVIIVIVRLLLWRLIISTFGRTVPVIHLLWLWTRPNPWEAEWTGRGCSKDKVHEAFKCLRQLNECWCVISPCHQAKKYIYILHFFYNIYLLSVEMLSWYNMKICEVLVCDIFLAVLFFKCLQPYVGISKGSVWTPHCSHKDPPHSPLQRWIHQCKTLQISFQLLPGNPQTTGIKDTATFTSL